MLYTLENVHSVRRKTANLRNFHDHHHACHHRATPRALSFCCRRRMIVFGGGGAHAACSMHPEVAAPLKINIALHLLSGPQAPGCNSTEFLVIPNDGWGRGGGHHAPEVASGARSNVGHAHVCMYACMHVCMHPAPLKINIALQFLQILAYPCIAGLLVPSTPQRTTR